ncbi:MAG TPA: carboxypeptidase-like regulatory domain-containing protein [Cytophagales bacterium]|nr:carboxypeptidase-like regulatory domain-containing protein [Cytophagales bacterium]
MIKKDFIINGLKVWGILVILFTIIQLPVLSQNTNPSIILSGNVYTSDSLEAVPFATVMIKKSKTGTVCNENGYFVLETESYDTLVISAVGFSTKEYIVPVAAGKRVYDKILLNPKTYELQEVGVYAYKNYQGFKQDFINLDIPEQKTAFIPPTQKVHSENTNPTMTLNAPFTAVYNKFSKRGREERKAAELKIHNNKKQEAFRKYNREYVASILKIKDKELDDFMEYCQLSPDFVLSTNEYELVMAIKNCYLSFKN